MVEPLRYGMVEPLRVLVVGFLNSPHITSWAEAVIAGGNEVEMAGRDAPGLPPSVPARNVHVLPAEGAPLLRSLRMSHALARLAEELDPHLIHAHWLSEFGWMAAREQLEPLVCSAWGSDVLNPGVLGRHRSAIALRRATLVFADSANLARATHALARREVRVEVVRWGLDLNRFFPGEKQAARLRLGLAGEGPLIASVRGFGAVYNPDVLLEAFTLIRARRPDARLLLKHPGDDVPAGVVAVIKRLHLAASVTFLGNLAPEVLPDVYRAADVIVSIPSTDSSPRSVWEALACSRPVVVSDLPWARDELEPARHALLVPVVPDAVAEAIEDVLEDPAYAHDLGAAGRLLVLAELDPAACAARINTLYRSVAGVGL